MENDVDIDFAKFISALRRSARLLVAVAVVGGGLGVLAATRSPLQTSFVFKPALPGAELAAAGVAISDLDIAGAVSAVAAELAADQLDDDISAELGSTIEVDVVPDDAAGTVSVSVSAADADDVDAAVDQVVQYGQAAYAAEVGAELTSVRMGVERRLEAANDRLLESLASAAAASDDQELLVEGLLVEAERWKRDIDSLDSTLVGLSDFESTLPDGLRRLGGEAPERSRGMVTLAIIGFMLGLIAAAFVVLLRAGLDRSIRSRRDLDRLGFTNLLAVMRRGPMDQDLEVAAAAFSTALERVERRTLQLVPLARDRTSPDWVTAVGERMSAASVVLRPPLDTEIEPTLQGIDGSLTVLIVRWGRDTAPDLVLAANRLAAVGAPEVGIVLVGIPSRELSSVEA